MAKRSMASLLPRFNSIRMVSEYVSRFYLPASRQGSKYADSGFEAARRLAEWKAQVRKAWPRISIRRLDTQKKSISFGESVRFETAVNLDGLRPEDVAVELLISQPAGVGNGKPPMTYRFESEGVRTEQGEQRYGLDLEPELCGKLEYRIRVYPHHELLTHPFEMGMMRWL